MLYPGLSNVLAHFQIRISRSWMFLKHSKSLINFQAAARPWKEESFKSKGNMFFLCDNRIFSISFLSIYQTSGWGFLRPLIGYSNSGYHLLFISRHSSGKKDYLELSIHCFWYILRQSFISVSELWIFTSPLRGSANIYHCSPPLWWIIVN